MGWLRIDGLLADFDILVALYALGHLETMMTPALRRLLMLSHQIALSRLDKFLVWQLCCVYQLG